MKITIITVCFNAEETIEKAIKSVISQKNSMIEYIVIDGKSTDNTHAVIEKYKSQIDTFISEKDCGLWHAMNKGVEKSTGDYIGILNADDYYYDNTLSRVIEYFDKYDVDYIMGPVERNGVLRIANNPERANYSFSGLYSSHSVGFFCSNKVYETIGNYNIRYHSADYDFYLKMVKNFEGKILKEVEPFGFFDSGGYSDKVHTISKILEQAEIRRINGFGRLHTISLLLFQLIKGFNKL